MKFRRRLSGLLLGVGCATAFIGLLAVTLPTFDNAQLRAVVSSFDTSSRFALVNAVNALFRFAMEQGWLMAGIGVASAVAGGVLFARFTPPPRQIAHTPAAIPPPPPPPIQRENPFAAVPPDPNGYTFAPSFTPYQRPILEKNHTEP